MKKILIIGFVVLACFSVLTVKIYAQRGCCSWHDGVCGCQNGSIVCCDGSYSPSCTCGGGYSTYLPPPDFPLDMRAEISFYHNIERIGKNTNVFLDLDDPEPTEYSAVISKCRGCDPGPLTDFTAPKLIFPQVKAGQWYVNVKKKINGRWSKIVYWTVDVPAWVAPTPIPTQSLEYDDYDDYDDDDSHETDDTGSLLGLATIGGGALFGIKWLMDREKQSNS